MTNPTIEEMFEKWASEGDCPALVNDDNGHWAVVFDGVQNVPDGPDPQPITTSFWIEAHQWKDTIAEALRQALDEDQP